MEAANAAGQGMPMATTATMPKITHTTNSRMEPTRGR